jgi:hypothetical protein
MRTTVDLPDELFRQVKAKAALDGVKLKQLITRYIEQGLQQAENGLDSATQSRRSLLPIARKATGQVIPALTNRDIHTILDLEELVSASD